MSLSDLTVLITTRNRPGLLAVALQSVHDAFGPGTRVILGDNGDAKATRAMLAGREDFSLNLDHRTNPPGSSYTDNLQMLVDACATPWLSLLHDDDFFVGSAGERIRGLLQDPGIDFIFSDHWMAVNEGTLDEALTRQTSERYGRARLTPGLVSDLALLSVQNSICLDGFFLRTEAARRHRLDRALPLFAQNKWMIEVCASCRGGGYFVPDRLFAYRTTAGSFTSQGMDHAEIVESLRRTVLAAGPAKTALRARIRSEWWTACKAALKRGTILSFLRRRFPAQRG